MNATKRGYATLRDAMRCDATRHGCAYRCVRFRIVEQSEITSACAFYERQLYSKVRMYRNVSLYDFFQPIRNEIFVNKHFDHIAAFKF